MDNKHYIRRANYYETDTMGIIHHSNHIRYFEEARINFMHNIGCDVKELEKLGVIIPNIDAYAKYNKPIKFFDEVCIEIKIATFTGSRLMFEYVIRFCDTGEVAAVGHTTHCFVNAEFKPMSLKRAFPEYYEKLKNNIAN